MKREWVAVITKSVKTVLGIFNFLEHIRNVSFHRKKDFVISLFLFEKCHSTDEIDNKFLNFLFLYLGLINGFSTNY